MEIRKLKENERELAVKLRRYSFGNWSDSPATSKETDDVIPEQSFGVFEGGRLVSLIRNYGLKQCVRGLIKDMCGVASIGTYPDCRYKGYVKKLLENTFQYMKEHDYAVSMLMPFKESFYQKYGYVKANGKIILKMRLGEWSYYLKKNTSSRLDYVMLDAREGKRIYLDFVKTIANTIHGFTMFPDIQEAEWNKAVRDEIIVLVKNKENGIVEGLAKYRKSGFMDKGEIIISEIYWKDLNSRDALFSYFARHIDQINYITLPIPMGVNFYSWFLDSLTPFEATIHHYTWMVRVMDVIKAVSGLHSVNYDGSLVIELNDPHCKWNNGLFEIRSENGILTADKTDSFPTLSMDIKAMSSLVYGALSIEELLHRRWISFHHNNTNVVEALGLLRKWFPTRFIFIPNDFRTTYL